LGESKTWRGGQGYFSLQMGHDAGICNQGESRILRDTTAFSTVW
jgi:hypothetical protein